MADVRRLADAGCGVLAVSAVGRQKDQHGRSGYDGLNLASFRESSELEYGADAAYLLVRSADSDEILLKCVKNRNDEPRDVPLRFVGEFQRFDPPAAASPTPRPGSRWSDA
jgi:replicative DNA helicase